MNKKVIIISILIIAICAVAVGVIIFSGNEDTKEVYTKPTNQETQNLENITNTLIENEMQEELQNEIQNNIQNEVQNSVVENTTATNTNQTTQNNPTEILPEEPKKGEEKAVDIVKADWGEDSNVKFQVETIDANGDYVVSVRDIKTTEAKAFYTVNTTTGTFSK